MRPHLVFTLAAPLASFGAVAVGERRPSWNRPSKSQILGMVASAIGIERREEARQQALAQSFGLAIRVDDEGQVNLHGICSSAGLGGNPYRDGTYEYYIGEPIVTNNLHGVGAFILAAYEFENLKSF